MGRISRVDLFHLWWWFVETKLEASRTKESRSDMDSSEAGGSMSAIRRAGLDSEEAIEPLSSGGEPR